MADNKQQPKTYKQAANDYYNQKYETWMPWIEDQYLKWFTKDNKASYAAKRTFPSSSFLSSLCHRNISANSRFLQKTSTKLK